MITQRPVIGSFRSSQSNPPRSGSMKGARGSSSPRFQILLLLGASGRDVPHSNLPLWAESVFVKPRHGVVSGPVVDRQNVKPARAIADMAFREKPLRRSNEHVLLVSGNAQFGQAACSSLSVRVLTSTNASVAPS